jgi:hypothetical protein
MLSTVELTVLSTRQKRIPFWPSENENRARRSIFSIPDSHAAITKVRNFYTIAVIARSGALMP